MGRVSRLAARVGYRPATLIPVCEQSDGRSVINVTRPVSGRQGRPLDLASKPLTQPEADQLAADIVTISDFYSLPLDFFLGIGAMENNYMNVKGDLSHAVFKRRAGPGDAVLNRQRGRVLVLNQASSMWQITRETLRYAHKLYLKDTRDHSQLPRLQPPKELNPDDVDPAVLTTYAGLLFRNLLDRFHGTSPAPSGRTTVVPGIPIREKRESAWSPTTPGALWNMLLSSMAAQPSQ
jgi:hypothetical protein